MKIALQYLNDSKGNTQAVQIPFSEWEKLLQKLNKYEQALKLKSNLKAAFLEVNTLSTTKKQKQTLKDFLHEL